RRRSCSSKSGCWSTWTCRPISPRRKRRRCPDTPGSGRNAKSPGRAAGAFLSRNGAALLRRHHLPRHRAGRRVGIIGLARRAEVPGIGDARANHHRRHIRIRERIDRPWIEVPAVADGPPPAEAPVVPGMNPAAMLPAREVTLMEMVDVAIVPAAVVPLLEAAPVVVVEVVGERRGDRAERNGSRRKQAKETCRHCYLQ